MIVSELLDQRQAVVSPAQLAAEEQELRASLAQLKPGALRRKAEEAGCDPVKLARALGGRRLVDGCGTVEPVSAVATVQYLRMAEVAEVGLDRPRSLSVSLSLSLSLSLSVCACAGVCVCVGVSLVCLIPQYGTEQGPLLALDFAT